MKRRFVALFALVLCLSPWGCRAGGKLLKQALFPTDVQIVRYHVKANLESLEEFTRRLYLKNPKFEKDLKMRKDKINGIFHGGELPQTDYTDKPSHMVLEAAFTANPTYQDRIFLLGLGLAKSIRETYHVEGGPVVSSMEISLEQLEKLYHNISHVKWRLKVYRDEGGDALFLTNEPGEDGYINMGYEVILTEVLTRIQDDIFLRGGSPPKLFFTMSTLFLSIAL
ncbi:MAG: hypothetical protein JXD19_12485 [Deltaproteobacteria bacterium]|nr:hypothetical protein [Deltaproteobacteria bacterium]